jgi:hypothetical protein
LSNVGCSATFVRSHPEDPDFFNVTLVDLGLDPLDLVYMSGAPPEGGETEIERRFRCYVREEVGLPPDADVDLDLSRNAGGFGKGIAEFVEFARRIHDLLGGSTPLRPDTLCRPNDVPDVVHASTDLDDLEERAALAYGKLDDVGRVLSDGTANKDDVHDALMLASGFGIADAIPNGGETLEQLAGRRESTLTEVERRSAAYVATIPGEPDPEQTVDVDVNQAIASLHALFGDGFAVLPRFALPQIESLAAAFDQDTLYAGLGEERVWLWLQQVAETHASARRLEDVLMVAQAWAAGSIDGNPQHLNVAQLPYCETRRWQALSDDEITSVNEWLDDSTPVAEASPECVDPTEGRPRGVTSIVALGTADTGVANLAGLLIDQWSETMPSAEVTTGVSFQYDQPSAQAPQALLLAVPSRFEKGGTWSDAELADIVEDTLTLSKIRLVDLDALPAVGAVFPALFLPTDPHKPSWKRDFDIKPLTTFNVDTLPFNHP